MIVPGLAQHPLQVLWVVVPESPCSAVAGPAFPPKPAHPHPHDERVVAQLVQDHNILGTEDRPQNRKIRVVSRVEQEGGGAVVGGGQERL